MGKDKKILQWVHCCGRAKANQQTLSWKWCQWHLLKPYTAELEQNVGTFSAFIRTSNWYEWYVSEVPGVEFKVRLMSMQRTCAAAWYARAHRSSHECNFPNRMERILQLKIISVHLIFANHVAVF